MNLGRNMAYCQKCGSKNEDDAEFCKKCGASLSGKSMDHKKGDPCEEECVVGKRSSYAPIFWGAIVILVGLWILFEFVLKNTVFKNQLPVWLEDFSFWWLIGLIIAIAVIMTGIRILVKK